jgi:hypothetical protein
MDWAEIRKRFKSGRGWMRRMLAGRSDAKGRGGESEYEDILGCIKDEGSLYPQGQ